MIAIIDYGLNNLASVRNAFRAAGAEVTLTADRAGILSADGVVLPGIGAAGAGMRRLRDLGLDTVVREVTASGLPLLGICLGMQLLFEHSAEDDAPCLGLIPGTVRLLRGAVKIPHIGWNQVDFRGDNPLGRAVPAHPYFYFVHSYVCEPRDPADIAGTTDYGEVFCSAVVRERIWGTQFHPERSGQTGQKLIKNFARVCRPVRSPVS